MQVLILVVVDSFKEMFTKRSHQDVKKSSVKIQDSKKDSATRLKHLKILLEHYDLDEAKLYFENNYSHVYFILYDNFIQVENNLKQRVHKASKEDLEASLSLLEKILCLLPELLGKRWQLHSLSRIFSKLLHPGNSQKLRAESIRYFLMWYQALGENSPGDVHRMFATLIPGIPEPQIRSTGSPIAPKPFELISNIPLDAESILQHPNFNSINHEDQRRTVLAEQPAGTGFMGKIVNATTAIFHDTNSLNPVQLVEVLPLIPPSTNEKPIENETKYFLEILLDAMAVSVAKVYWKDRSHLKAVKCFVFLLEKFKTYYMPYLCPQYDASNSLYKPNLDLPNQHNILEDEFVTSRVALIKWIATCIHVTKKQHNDGSQQPSSLLSSYSNQGTPTPAPSLHHEESETSFSVGHVSDGSRASSHDSTNNSPPHQCLDSTINASAPEEISSIAVVRDALCSSKEQVDFMLEVLRQAFLLPFSQAATIRRVIALYKDWIQANGVELPIFLSESSQEQICTWSDVVPPQRRLRADSYIGAMNKENVRAGLQNILQVFMTQAANVFLSTWCPATAAAGSLSHQQLLEEQTDTCKRILNIYRYMVMHVAMDGASWEQLLLVLLQITSLVLTKTPTKRKSETLGGSLAPALFQTLIVTWIKANLNVAVRPELWQSLMDVLGKLTNWEELIKEWAKTMETLTRVLARHAFSLELTALASDSKRVRRPLPQRAPQPQTLDRDNTSGKQLRCNQESPKESSQLHQDLRRCCSDTNLYLNKKSQNDELDKLRCKKQQRRHSFESIKQLQIREEQDYDNDSRSPSPAPSSGVESSSFKDSPLQIDLTTDNSSNQDDSLGVGGISGARGVACGGSAKGWLWDVAGVLWRRMLGALGDPNHLTDPQHHHSMYSYLLHLNDTLAKIASNQTLNGNIETHVPFSLFAGWCLEAETLPPSFRQGKLKALQLLCSSTQSLNPQGPQTCNTKHLAHLNLYQRALHHGLTGEDRSVVDVIIKYAAPRYLSLAYDGYSLLLLDFVHASTVVLNSTDLGPTCPRTEAVAFLGSLLNLPDKLIQAPMLQPYPHRYNTVFCPDLKEHIVNIVVRVCRRESTAKGRCAGACALLAHIHHALVIKHKDPRTPQHVLCLLHMLTMKNKSIAKVVADGLIVLTDSTETIIDMYPGLAGKIVRWVCACLAKLSPSCNRESVKPLAGSLLLCLAEFCIRIGPVKLMGKTEANSESLLLTVFKVLYAVMHGSNGTDIDGLTLSIDEDFDPEVQLDNLQQKNSAPNSSIDVKLWAQTICTRLVLSLGHWPLSNNYQLSSTVCEGHDGGSTNGQELSSELLISPHAQLMRLTNTTLLSLLDLPAPALPGGNGENSVICRAIVRSAAGKACWDAVPLQYIQATVRLPPYPVSIPAQRQESRDVVLLLPPPHQADQIPEYTSCPPDQHQLDRLLQYMEHTSPEVCSKSGIERSVVTGAHEAEVMAAVLSHRNAVAAYHNTNVINVQYRPETPTPTPMDSQSQVTEPPPFYQCRLFLSQLGVLNWSQRKPVQLLKRTDRLIRELKNLDSQRCRETHKVAIIYVGRGQENRNEILSNRCGSQAYEAFLAALAWEVELESHVGFSGGLGKGGGGGSSAPYLATPTLEALFHVATRMPSNTPDAILNKTRHLGNDEVHVIWSEHWREYRRDTLPTQFCDVLLVLYPLPYGLLRVTISRKPDVCLFGPLWEECVVSVDSAAALVRACCWSAGRAVRATLALYQHAYSERERSLDTVATHHANPTTYEKFIAALRNPSTDHTDQDTGSLAAALLDHNTAQLPWNLQSSTQSSNNDSTGISPRPSRRLGPFKRPQPPSLQPIIDKTFNIVTPPSSPPVPAARRNR